MPRSRSIAIQSEAAWRCVLAGGDRAGQLDRAAVEQQLFRQRRLAGVRVRDDGERARRRGQLRCAQLGAMSGVCCEVVIERCWFGSRSWTNLSSCKWKRHDATRDRAAHGTFGPAGDA